MTTKKAYEVKNSHEAYCENIDYKLGKLISKAWDICESIDYITEWDEQPLGTIINVVAEVDPHIAEILEIEASVTYGDGEVEVKSRDDEDWGHDW